MKTVCYRRVDAFKFNQLTGLDANHWPMLDVVGVLSYTTNFKCCCTGGQ